MKKKGRYLTLLISDFIDKKTIDGRYRKCIANKFTYIEPFVCSGAILFCLLNNFPKIEKVINDINYDLTNTYKVIASKPNELISLLKELQREYHNTNTVVKLGIKMNQ